MMDPSRLESEQAVEGRLQDEQQEALPQEARQTRFYDPSHVPSPIFHPRSVATTSYAPISHGNNVLTHGASDQSEMASSHIAGLNYVPMSNQLRPNYRLSNDSDTAQSVRTRQYLQMSRPFARGSDRQRAETEDSDTPRSRLNAQASGRKPLDHKKSQQPTIGRAGRESEDGQTGPTETLCTNTSLLEPSRLRNEISLRPQILDGASATKSFGKQLQFRHLLPIALRDFAAVPRNNFRAVASYVLQDPKLLEVDPQLLLNEAVRAYAFGKREYGDSLVQQHVIVARLQRRLSDGERQNPNTFFQSLAGGESHVLKAHFQDFDMARSAAREKEKHTNADNQSSSLGPGAPEVNDTSAAAADGHSRPQLQPHRTKSGQDVGEPNMTRYAGAPNPSATGATSRFGPEAFPPKGGATAEQPKQQTSKFSTPQNPGTQALGLPNNGLDGGAYQPPSRALGPVPREQQTQQQRPPTTSAINPQAPGPVPPSRVNDENDELGRLPAEGLDPRFIVRDSHFYRVGRVFSLIWHENLSETAKVADPSRYTYTSRGAVSTGRFGQKIYTTARRMVVVRAGKGFCVCIQINTYAGRGLAKFRKSNEDVQAHSRIYMDDTQPLWLPDEPRSEKKSIAVRKSKPEQRLEPACRLCYSRPHTVDHTVKSMDVGLVYGQSLHDVLCYYAEINNIV